MHYTGPYEMELTWHIRAAMNEYDIEPSRHAEEIGRQVAHLQD